MARADTTAAAAAFGAVAAGALGAWLGGLLADRVGRTTVAAAAMAGSAACALGIGWLHGGPPALLVAVALVWGVAVIADSAQFSASIAELAEPDSVGTLLTAQTCAGFLLTLVSIQLVPPVVAALGWPGAFTMLAAGPVLGCVAMARLRRHPAAARLAGGRG
jgi:MFS family permease